ncbi:MAG: hypothetical protein JW838_12470 [Spirochaetes bacterium]|nr:hypothetical protein [Spirochaetota bacterium]
MKKAIIHGALFSTVVILFVACGGYNLNFLPPADNAKPQDIFPADIDGLKPALRKAGDIGGITAVYGNGDISIRVTRMKDREQADMGFKQAIVPQFKDFPTRSSGKINGVWKASGTDGTGRSYFAWVNTNYIFMITGKDKAHMLKGIDAFQYISR